MSDWLDLELSHHLAPVAAPEALWDRVSRVGLRPASARRGDRPGGLSFLPIAAILTLTAAATVLWLVAQQAAQRPQPALDLQQLAREQLRHPEPLAIHSDDPRAISAWMRQAGIDMT